MGALYPNRYLKILEASPALLRAAENADIPRGDPGAPALCCVMGPALAEFTRWLLLNTVQERIERLYFLARDGWWMREAAQIFCAEYGLPIECRYLSCSRHALRLPLFHRDHAASLDRLCAPGPASTPDRLLARAGLTPEERSAVLRELALPLRADAPIPRADMPQFRAALGRSTAFLTLADRHSLRALPALTGYLEQEGLAAGKHDAVVDSGWIGTLQQSLTDACALIGREERVTGFYFGLYEVPRAARRADYRCYYFSPEGGLREKAHFSNNLFEAVMTAPHGTTTHYAHAGVACIPVYAPMAETHRIRILQCGELMMRYIRSLAHTMGRDEFFRADFSAHRRTVRRLLQAWMDTPTHGEAVYFGTLPFSDDVLPGADRELAVPPAPALIPRSEPWHAGSRVRYMNRTGASPRYTLYQYARHSRASRPYQVRKEVRP